MDEKTLALTIANIALDKQAQELEIIDVSGLVSYADYIVVCGGRSERQVRAIAEAIEAGLKALGVTPLGTEGKAKGQWLLMDYDAVIVHVLLEQARIYYDIEGLWLDAKRLDVEEPSAQLLIADSRGRCASGS